MKKLSASNVLWVPMRKTVKKSVLTEQLTTALFTISLSEECVRKCSQKISKCSSSNKYPYKVWLKLQINNWLTDEVSLLLEKLDEFSFWKILPDIFSQNFTLLF